MGKKIIKIVVALILVGLLFAGGWYLRGAYDLQQQEAVTTAASQYVQDLTSGRMEAAYNSSSTDIKSAKTVDEFTQSFGNLTTNNLEVVSTRVAKTDDGYEVYQDVNNLPAASNGQTDGIFSIILVNEGGKWKVSAATVQ